MPHEYDDFHSQMEDEIANAECDFFKAKRMKYAEGMAAAYARIGAYQHALAAYARMPSPADHIGDGNEMVSPNASHQGRREAPSDA